LFGSSYLFAFTVGVRCAFEYCGDWWLQALEYVSYFMLCSSRNDLERAKRGLGHAKPAFELNSGPLDPRSREAPPPLCRWI
jgi:hypothetical protein